MASSLAGTLPKDRYKQLLRVDGTAGVDGTLRPLADGEGTETPLRVSATEATLGASGAPVDKILDEDDMASDDAKALPTQQSVKAYIDNFRGSRVSPLITPSMSNAAITAEANAAIAEARTLAAADEMISAPVML